MGIMFFLHIHSHSYVITIVLFAYLNTNAFWTHLGNILVSTWRFEIDIEANMASKLLSSSLQAHNKTSKQPLCKLSEGLLPPEIGQKH